jgi:hypothetical protein
MILHIYIDTSELETDQLLALSEPVTNALADWVGEKKHLDLLQLSDDEPKLGLRLQIKSKFKLKDPLNFLHQLAKTHKCEFAVAIYDTKTDSTEDVCYFGYEEGQPDLFEIANYLDL